MNDCPRQNPAYRSASLFIKPRFGGVFAFWVRQMNDCPRRYAQKNAAYRSASLVIKPRFGGVFAFWVSQMNDCPRRYAQKNAPYRSASLFNKTPLRWVFCFLGRLPCLMALRLSGLLGDKVFTPPSGRGFTASIEIGFRGCRRLFPSYLIFISLLFMHRISFI